MTIQAIDGRFSVCRTADGTQIDLTAPFTFFSRTDEELSLVCRTEHVPANATAREDGWRAFRIQGPLDFSLIGILARVSGILAEEKIGIFVVSTYNTDFVLTREEHFPNALAALRRHGYSISENII